MNPRIMLFRLVVFVCALGYLLMFLGRFISFLSPVGFAMISFTCFPLLFVSIYALIKMKEDRIWAIVGLLLAIFTIVFITSVFIALKNLQ